MNPEIVLLGGIFKLIGVVIFILGVLPRMWNEMWVANGLGRLRKSIFLSTIIYVGMQTLSLFALEGFISDLFVLLAGVSNIVIGIIMVVIYHSKYKEPYL